MTRGKEQEIEEGEGRKTDRDWIGRDLDPFPEGVWDKPGSHRSFVRKEIPAERPLGVYKSNRQVDEFEPAVTKEDDGIQEHVDIRNLDPHNIAAQLREGKVHIVDDGQPIARVPNQRAVPRSRGAGRKS